MISSRSQRPGRNRTLWVPLQLALAFLLVAAALVQPPAVAAAGSKIAGVIWADSNKNSTRETGTYAEPFRQGVAVELVNSVTSTVVATTTTDVNGAYQFLNVADGTYRVRATAPAAFNFPATATGTNDFVAAGSPGVGMTPLVPPITIAGATQALNYDGALQPIATLTVNPITTAGACNNLQVTGAAPFDATDGDGKDSSASNCLVRTNDWTETRYSVTLTNLPAGVTVNNVYVDITVSSTDGAAPFMGGSVPTGCLSSGVTPGSGVNSTVFRCNFGAISTNNSTVTIQGPVLSAAPTNATPGSHFHVTAVARSNNGEAATSAPLDGPDITVTDALRWDANISGAAGALQVLTIDGVSQRGYIVNFNNTITPAVTKGEAAFVGPLTFSNRLAGYPNAILYSCSNGLVHTPTAGNNVACTNASTRQRDADGDWKFTVPAGTYTVNSGWTTSYFIPETDANRVLVPGWNPGDPYPTGNASINNKLVETENQIKGAQGQPNYATSATPGYEPGWDGTTATGNNTTTFNIVVTPPTVVINGSQRYFSPLGGCCAPGPFYPGLGVGGQVTVSTNGTTRLANVNTCQVFDVSAMEYMVGGTGLPNSGGAPAGYVLEFAIGPNSTNLGTSTTSPYGAQSLLDAADTCVSTPRTWSTNPAATFGANWRDQVNMVRMRPVNPATELAESSSLQITQYLRMRATYNGGPNAGQPIPQNTRIPIASGWTDPNDANGFKSVIGQDIYVQISAGTVKTVAQSQYAPGDLVQYTIRPQINGARPGITFRQSTVTDTLDSRLTYDAACTEAALPAGLNVSYNPATRQVTVAYGDVAYPASFPDNTNPMTPENVFSLPSFKICARLSATAIPGQTVNNTASYTTPDINNGAPLNGSVGFTINAAGRLGIQKSVDHPLIEPGQTVTWSIDWVNSNATLDLSAPDVIDVLPYNGDGSSSFTGTFTMSQFPVAPTYTTGGSGSVPGTWYFATAAPSTINRDPTSASNANPQDPGGLWQTEAEIGVGGLSSITAARFVHSGQLLRNQTVRAQIQQVATTTTLNNKYFNKSTIFSASASSSALTSNESYVLMPGFSLGDRIWRDKDESGTFTTGDQPLAGVDVDVLNASDVVVGHAVTDANGRWFVAALPAGTYRARIPASAFAGPVLLASDRVLTVASNLGPGKNESQDNNNTATPTPQATGLTSTPVTFTYNRTGGFITGGNGPSGDNAGGLGDELIPDDFTDFTIDLTVVPPVSIKIDKTADVSLVSNAGDRIRYSFLVTNTGGVTLNNVGVTDTFAGPAGPALTITCPKTVLAAAEAMTCTASNYTSTQADIDNGKVDNSATATGSSPSGNQVTDTDTLSVPAGAVPQIKVTKLGDTSIANFAGDVVHYTFGVTNTGNVTLTNVGVTDTFTPPATAPGAVTCPVTTLAPGQSTNCTMAAYTVTQPDVNNGKVDNSATATGTPPSGPAVTSQPSTWHVTIPRNPQMTVDKTADVAKVFAAGDTVNYSFVVTNTGNLPLTSVSLSDQFAGGPTTVPSCPQPTLAVGASETCTSAYSVTQADIDNGSVVNTVTSSGTPPSGPVVHATDTLTVPAAGSAAISITKTADHNVVNNVGDTVTYTFTVTNTGTLTVHDAAVADTMAPPASQLTISCPVDNVLSPGEKMICTSDPYAASQADVNNGKIDNDVVATAKTPTNADVSATTSLNVPVPANPDIALTKTADVTGFTRAGTTITYTLRVVNKGNVTLDNIAVTDLIEGVSKTVTCPWVTPNQLDSGEAVNCTVTYTTVQADVDRGSLGNAAHVVGTPPSGVADNVTDDATLSIPATRSPSMSLDKTATPTTVRNAGDHVTYDFLVTNTGNVTLTNIAVEDHFTPSGTNVPVTCAQTTLAPQASVTCTVDYVVTLADINRGSIDNQATATADSPTGAVTPVVDTAHVDATSAPAIDIVKSGDTATAHVAGDQVGYTFTVTNSGNITLTNVAVDDPKLAGLTPAITVSCPSTTLAPNDSTTCTASAPYTVTQADVDAGQVDNTATATGRTGAGATITSVSSSWHVTIADDPSVTLVKTSTQSTATNAGDHVDYKFRVTNTGNTTQTAVHVDDPMLAAATPAVPVTCPSTTLAPNAFVDCTATYVVTQADVDAGQVDNSATATASSPKRDVNDTDAAPTVTIAADPKISVEKKASQTSVDANGDLIDYTFTVTNDGNVTLDNVSIDDQPTAPATAPTISCPTTGPVAPQASITCTATYTVSQADVNHGEVKNSATATADPPTGTAVTSAPSTVTVPATQAPHLKIVKSGSTATSSLNGQVTYDFTVTNDGNVSLTDVLVTDTFASPASSDMTVTCDKTALDPNEQAHCTGSKPYVVSQDDVDNGTVDNSATATGTPQVGSAVTSAPSTWTVTMTREPAIALVKAASVQVVHSVGDKIDYTFKVSNPGNVTLSNVEVTDQLEAPAGPALTVSCPRTSLAPAAEMTCTATYKVKQADLDHGKIVNAATATADAQTDAAPARVRPRAVVVSATDDVTVVVETNPAPTMALTKKVEKITDVNHSNTHDPGDLMFWSFEVRNTGTVPITEVAINDPMLAKAGIKVTCPAGGVDPGEVKVCHSKPGYEITDADAERGTIQNSATAKASYADGEAVYAVSSPSSVTRTAISSPQVLVNTGLGAEKRSGSTWRVSELGAGILLLGLGLGWLLFVAVRRRRS